MELQIINKYFIATRRNGEACFRYCLRRVDESQDFSWVDMGNKYHWNKTFQSHVVYGLRLQDMLPYRYTFVVNRHFSIDKENISSKPFPLPNFTFTAIANFNHVLKMLVAVDLPEHGSFEFRIYNLYDFDSYVTVSSKIHKLWISGLTFRNISKFFMQIISDSNNTSYHRIFFVTLFKNNNFHILSFCFAIKIVILETIFAHLVRINSTIYTCNPINLQRWTCYY